MVGVDDICLSLWRSIPCSCTFICSVNSRFLGIYCSCEEFSTCLTFGYRKINTEMSEPRNSSHRRNILQPMALKYGDLKTWVRFKNTYELLNQRALKFSYVNKIHIFQCMGKIFCVEFQRYPLKFHTKYLTHTLKDMIFMQFWNFKSS